VDWIRISGVWSERSSNVCGLIDFSRFFASQVRGTTVLGAMRDAETAVVPRIAILSSLRTEIQSGHARSAARLAGPHVSRDARTVSKRSGKERTGASPKLPGFFINAAAAVLVFFQVEAGGGTQTATSTGAGCTAGGGGEEKSGEEFCSRCPGTRTCTCIRRYCR